MRKLRTTLLLVVLLSFLPLLTVHAGDAYVHGYFRYTVEDKSVTITDYFGDEEEVTIPGMIAGNPVNVIKSGAFADSEAKIIHLPDTIMTVEEGAFSLGQTVYFFGQGAQVIESTEAQNPGGNTESSNDPSTASSSEASSSSESSSAVEASSEASKSSSDSGMDAGTDESSEPAVPSGAEEVDISDDPVIVASSSEAAALESESQSNVATESSVDQAEMKTVSIEMPDASSQQEDSSLSLEVILWIVIAVALIGVIAACAFLMGKKKEN